MPNSLFNQVPWCQATIGASSKATSPKAGGTAGSPWRAAAGRKGAESGAGAVFAGHGLMFVVSGSCWVLCCGWCNGTGACDVLQAAKAAKAQAESETLAKAKSMVGCHGAIATNLLQLNFQNATIWVLVINDLEWDLLSQKLRPQPQLKHQAEMVKRQLSQLSQLPLQLHWMSSQGRSRHRLGISNMMGTSGGFGRK